ncbi:MAG: calcium/sodium antiporter [Cyanophyceae cyanobacterium]
MEILLILIGIALLYFGGEVLVNHSSRLALSLRLSPAVIGLTIVAFGTSSPELLATLTATLQGAPDMAVGNVVGSNIANLGLILGLSAIIFPLRASSQFIRREVPFMIFAVILLVPFSVDETINRVEGAILCGLLVLYLLYLFKNDASLGDDEFTQEYGQNKSVKWSVVGVVAGIALLVAGAQSLVLGAVDLARNVGISERVIGLSIVAVGTSLPELASSLVAAMKREGNIVLGNLIGSNIFNVLGILGTTAVFNPIAVSANITGFDLWIAIGISIVVLPLISTQLRIERWEGVILLATYVGYIVLIFS